jgi:YceI-like domain
MLKNTLTILFLFLVATGVAQKKLFTKTGTITFNSKTSIEKIQAVNKKVLAVLDMPNNKIEFAVLIKGFEFEKALMQEHFNENYLESDKYPKATFKGKFDNAVLISAEENKLMTVNVSGNLTMHGVTKPINSVATFTTKNKTISATTNFTILLSDYSIKIPSINKNNVNNQVQININLANLQEMK